uniref:Uncharacterized protein n=1 Tax=Anguilla anguilla TaxID=7936 RepID=A0A0E9PI68_ANGAN
MLSVRGFRMINKQQLSNGSIENKSKYGLTHALIFIYYLFILMNKTSFQGNKKCKSQCKARLVGSYGP